MLLLPLRLRAVAAAALAAASFATAALPPGPAPGPKCSNIVYCLDSQAYDRDFTNPTGDSCAEACGGNCCVGYDACADGRFSVCADEGDGSCSGSEACFDVATSRNVYDPDHPLADDAGWVPGRQGVVGLIYGGSCRGPDACYKLGMNTDTVGDIANGSCASQRACRELGFMGGVVGDIVNSCRGYEACREVAWEGEVGDILDSCKGTLACRSVQKNNTLSPGPVDSCCNGDEKCYEVNCKSESCPYSTSPLPEECEGPNYYLSYNNCERPLGFEECKDAAETLDGKWVSNRVPDSGTYIDHMPGGCFVKRNYNTGRIVKVRFSDNGAPGTLCDTEPTKDKWSKMCLCGRNETVLSLEPTYFSPY